MLWSRKAIEFSEEDTRLFIEIALPQLARKLGEPVYTVQNDALMVLSESHIRKQVETLLTNATTVLDTTEIATRLGVPRQSVDRVISAAILNVSAFSDGVHVLPAKRLTAISKGLTSMCSVSEICSEHQITIKAVEYIVRSNPQHLTRVGDIIVPNEKLTAHLQTFETALSTAAEPVEYACIEPDMTLLALIKTKLDIPQHKRVYFPQAYINQREQETLNILEKTGYASQSLVSEFTDPGKFAKIHESVVVDRYIIQSKFVAQQTQVIQQALQKNLYFDLRDLSLGSEFVNYLVSGDVKLSKLRGNGKKYPANYLVRPQLERDWLDLVTKETLKNAGIEVSKVSFDDLNGTSTVTEYVDAVSLPSLTDIQTQIPDSQALVDLKIAEHIWPSVRKAFRQQVTQLVDVEFTEAQLKLEAQIGVYLNGVLSLYSNDDTKNAELEDMVWHEWQQYVSDRQYNVPSSTMIAESQFKVADNPFLSEIRQNLITKSRAKLEKCLKSKKKDAALILHLASTIYHATHYCPRGLLKIRGKAVPRLLKRFDFPDSFSELKTKIRDPTPELLEAVAREAH